MKKTYICPTIKDVKNSLHANVITTSQPEEVEQYDADSKHRGFYDDDFTGDESSSGGFYKGYN